MLPDPVLELATSKRDGVMTNREICALGFTSWDLTRWVRHGWLERPALGVYRVGAPPADPRGALAVAGRYLRRRQRNCTSEAPGAPSFLLSGPAVLAAAGIDCVDPCRVVALVDHRRRVRLEDAPFDVRRTDLRGHPYHVRDGLPCADHAIALADLAAASVDDREVRTAVDAARWVGMEIVPAVRTWRAGAGGGFVRMARMADRGDFEQESEGERRAFATCFALSPPPDCQVWIAPGIRVDFAYLYSGLVFEYHGLGPHAGRLDEDAKRALLVLKLRYELTVVTVGMLDDPELPAYVEERRRRGRAELRSGRRAAPPPPVEKPRLTPLRTLPRRRG